MTHKIEAETEHSWGGHILTAGMYPQGVVETDRPKLVDTLEDCEAATKGDTWHDYRCTRKARYAATGPMLYEYNSTVQNSPTETRFLCTQHSRKDYLRVIVRKESE